MTAGDNSLDKYRHRGKRKGDFPIPTQAHGHGRMHRDEYRHE